MTSRCIQVLGLPLIALLLSIAGLAQNIRGTVTDSTGKAVAYASVNLINTDNNRIIGYAVTDAGGVYTLPVPVNTPLNKLIIQVTSIGYKARSRPITDVRFA